MFIRHRCKRETTFGTSVYSRRTHLFQKESTLEEQIIFFNPIIPRTILLSERPTLHGVLAALSAIVLTVDHQRKRGAIVQWLERLRYGIEIRRGVLISNKGFAIRRLEIGLCQPGRK